ncbi:MAG: ABC transporter permease subunit [Desulfobacteraceae bacterium]|nr:ABC transporter permease subunit [Desulfobacteraceae bacterium]
MILRNPVARKRLARFRSMKRAWISLWLLVILYGASLAAELLCNATPLYVRFEGRFFFPIFSYYAEDVFTGSGRQTRPDYKALAQSPAFAENDDNFMLFVPHPHGPYQSVDPKSIDVENQVTLRFSAEPRVASADIGPDLEIADGRLLSFFTRTEPNKSPPGRLSDYFDLPKKLTRALAERFANQAAPFVSFDLENKHGQTYTGVLAEYEPRDRTPETVRMLIYEPAMKDAGDITVSLTPDLQPAGQWPGLWEKISRAEQEVIKSLAAERFDAPVADYRVVADGRQYIAGFEKEDVRFPYPPVAGHPLGLDAAGRDVLARIVYGMRIAMSFGLLLVGASMSLGVAAGAVQGYYGGKLDITAQRFVEIWNALPFLYVMILMGSIYGRSFELLLVCYGLFNWIGISYYIRAEFLSLRKRPFVEAARCMGVSSRKIIFRHILPNALVPVITFFPFSLVGAIGALAALDYLGFGMPPPTASWGEMLFEAQQYRWAWWLIVYPSIALFTVMLLGVFVGEGVRNAYDPKQYTRME